MAKLKHYHRRGQNIHPCQCSNKLRPYMAASKGYYLKTQSSLKVHFTFKAAISCLVAGMPVYIILNLVFDTCSVHYMTVQQCKEKIQRRLSAICEATTVHLRCWHISTCMPQKAQKRCREILPTIQGNILKAREIFLTIQRNVQ